MRIHQHLKPEKIGAPLIELPPKRAKKGAVEARAFAMNKTGLVVSVPIELNEQDNCKKPQAWFSAEAFALARKETSKKSEALVIPITDKGAKTLDGTFELHDANPDEGVPTVFGFKEMISGENPKELLCVSVNALKKLSEALGSDDVVLYRYKDGRLLVKPFGDHNAPEVAVGVIGKPMQDTLDFHKGKENDKDKEDPPAAPADSKTPPSCKALMQGQDEKPNPKADAAREKVLENIKTPPAKKPGKAPAKKAAQKGKAGK